MTQTPSLASGASPADQSGPLKHPLVERYLEHVRVEKRLAQRTVELYTLDLRRLQANALQAGVALTEVNNSHVRRWVVQKRNGMAVLMITHDLNLVRRFADRVAVMENGLIVEQGRVDEVFARPQHAYTRAMRFAKPAA